MINIKTAFRLFLSNISHNFLVVLVFTIISLLLSFFLIFYNNIDTSITMSKDLIKNGDNLLYFCINSDYNYEEVKEVNSELFDKTEIYGIKLDLYEFNGQKMYVYFTSDYLYDNINYLVTEGEKYNNDSNYIPAITTANLDLGFNSSIEYNGVEKSFIICGKLDENTMYLSMTESGSNMELEYLYKNRKDNEYPILILPSDSYNISELFYSETTILNCNNLSSAEIVSLTEILNEYGDADNITAMYNRSKLLNNNILFISIPFLVIGLLIFLLIISLIMILNFDNNKYHLDILFLLGARKNNIIIPYLIQSLIFCMINLAITVPLTIYLCQLLRNFSLYIDLRLIWASILIFNALVVVYMIPFMVFYIRKHHEITITRGVY